MLDSYIQVLQNEINSDFNNILFHLQVNKKSIASLEASLKAEKESVEKEKTKNNVLDS